jgi:hypothetical protein
LPSFLHEHHFTIVFRLKSAAESCSGIDRLEASPLGGGWQGYWPQMTLGIAAQLY